MGHYDKDFWHALDQLIENSKVVIDRPIGAENPRYPDVIYPVDYGYLDGTSSMDGGGIEVWLGAKGEKRVDAVICVIDLTKMDSEIKLLLGCTEEEREVIYRFHNGSERTKGFIINR
ncbi:MAG: hypothetical protein H6Q74_2842 [Firmicutes bacterium]|nr:hypothetical protein [Bacillota bacterium]